MVLCTIFTAISILLLLRQVNLRRALVLRNPIHLLVVSLPIFFTVTVTIFLILPVFEEVNHELLALQRQISDLLSRNLSEKR
jgi:hypothetical protein